MNTIKGENQQKQMVLWAVAPSPAHERSGFKGSAWEDAIVGLVAAGDRRFFEVLRNHIKTGVIRSERATKVLNAALHGVE